MVDSLVNSEANSRRISMVESCFGTSGQPLVIPGRVLVGEGVLTKMCRKKPKPRQFFLFNDILVYGNIVLNKKKYNKQHVIPLEEVSLASIEDDGHFRNGWLIKTPTKSFAVYAATATEKAEWMAHITKCVTDLLRKSGKRAAELYAAVWVPDSEAALCMHCKKTQFTVINRKHHCRKCGNVVCGSCSNKKIILLHQSRKPLRVCLSCYDSLSSSKQPEDLNTSGVLYDSSGEDDSDDDIEDKNHEQDDIETMTFYGNAVNKDNPADQSNGVTSTQVAADSSNSAVLVAADSSTEGNKSAAVESTSADVGVSSGAADVGSSSTDVGGGDF